MDGNTGSNSHKRTAILYRIAPGIGVGVGNAEFVASMEEVLETYAQPYDER